MPTALPYRWNVGAFAETRAYLTDVQRAWDGTEQRRQLRGRARRSYRYEVATEKPEQAARLNALLHAGSTKDVAVPVWPYVTRLTSQAASGQPTISCPTALRPFFAGQYAMLWRGLASYELRPIQSVGGSSITLQNNLASTWPAGTVVVPCHVARLRDASEVGRPTARYARVTIEADVDPLAMPLSTGEPGADPVYYGPLPDREVGDRHARDVVIVDSQTAIRSHRARRSEAVTTQSYPLLLKSLAEVDAIWSWYDGRLGALSTSWVPSWQADLIPTAPIAAIDTEITIKAMDYTTRWFPIERRRQIVLLGRPLGTAVQNEVIAAVDNGNGTETLTLRDPAGVAIDPRSGLICACRLMRLEQDPVTVEWQRTELARCTLRFVEDLTLEPTTIYVVWDDDTEVTLDDDTTRLTY